MREASKDGGLTTLTTASDSPPPGFPHWEMLCSAKWSLETSFGKPQAQWPSTPAWAHPGEKGPHYPRAPSLLTALQSKSPQGTLRCSSTATLASPQAVCFFQGSASPGRGRPHPQRPAGRRLQ